MFYFILFFILILFALNDIFIKKSIRTSSYSLLIIVFVLVAVAGLRWETGVDWHAYTIWFDKTPIIGSANFFDIFKSLDIGFLLLISLIKTFGGNIQTIFFIMSIISFSFLYKALKMYTPYRNISIFLYFCLVFFVLDMSGIRQAVSLNIFFFSIRYIKDKNIKKYLIYILIAISFHWTAILFIPFYFFLNKRFSTIKCFIFTSICLLIAIFKINWISFFINFIIKYFTKGLFISKIIIYSTNNIFAVSKRFGFGGIAICLIFIFICIFRKKMEKRFPFFNIFFNLFLFYIFIFFGLFMFAEISSRLRFYTFLSIIILLPYFLFFIKTLESKTIYLFLMIFYGFLYVKPYLLSEEQAIAFTPYQNYIIHKVIFDKTSNGYERMMRHNEIYIETMKNNDY